MKLSTKTYYGLRAMIRLAKEKKSCSVKEISVKEKIPEKYLENQNFRAVFETCLTLMPARNARAFMMREVLELTSEEICKELSITQTNLWVILHRARLILRKGENHRIENVALRRI